MISIKNISKTFSDRVILNNISFTINKGEKIAIIGESGIGKSVLLKSIIGLLSPDDGNILIDNQDINQYMAFIVDRLFASNKYFNDQEPWKKKEDNLRLSTIVYTAIELIRKITILLYPVIPQTSVKVLNTFNIKEDEIDFLSLQHNEILKEKNKLNKLDILFKKIEK